MSAPRTPADFQSLVSDPNSSLCGNFIGTLLKLPLYVYQVFNWMFTAGGDLTDAFKRQIVQPGDLIFSATPLAESTSRKLCNGQAISRTTYADLFAAIGIAYGPGDATTTFNVPDFQAKFPVGVGSFALSGAVAIGASGGEDKVTLTVDELPAHRHKVCSDETATNTGKPNANESVAQQSNNTLSGGDNYKYSLEKGTGDSTIGRSSAEGGDDPHNNLPPYMGVYIYISC